MTDKLRSRLLTTAERIAALDRRWDETGEPMSEDEQTEYLEDASDLASLVLEVLGEEVAGESRPVALTAFECNLLRTLHRSRPLAPDIVKTLGGIVARLPYPDPRAAE